MKNKKVQSIGLLILVILLSAMILLPLGCKKKTQPAPTTAQEMPSEKNVPKSIETIEQTTCPVLDGNKIDKNVFVEYQGKKVYFCCPDCKAKFEAAPEKYISKLPQFAK